MLKRYLFSFTFLLGFLFPLLAQNAPDLTGRWEGKLNLPSLELRMELTFAAADDGEWAITVNVPQQGLKDLSATEVRADGDSIRFRLPDVPGNAGWSGAWKAADSETELDSLVGEWQQAGRSIALHFARPGGPLSGPVLASTIDQLRTYAERLREEMKVPGAGIAVVRKDEVVADFGVGYADLEAERAATGQTVFAIGSSSKAFTAFGLGLLVDEGKLDWDDPVIDHMPTFRLKDDFATREMTAVDLLTHRSGLPRHDLLWYANTGLSRRELFNRLPYLEPTASFRSTFQYQNLMYMTAGLLTEELSGKTWEDFTRERIFEPLGMSSANFDISTIDQQPDFAYGYAERDEELTRLPFHPISAIGPAGSINASAADVGKWVSLHLNGGAFEGKEIIDPGTLDFLHTPQIPMTVLNAQKEISLAQYALGWFVMDLNGTLVVQHGGNIDGFSALVMMAPEEEYGLVVLTNKNGTGYGGRLARYAIDLFNGDSLDKYAENDEEDEAEDSEEEEEDEIVDKTPVAGTTPHHDLKDYAGTYFDPGYGEVVVTLSEDEKTLTAAYGDWTNTLSHWHYDVFQMKDTLIGIDAKLNFRTADDGKVTGMTIALENSLPDPIVFSKQADASMTDAAYLDRLAGDYEISGQTLTVKRKGEILTLTVPGQPPYDLEAYAEDEFKLAGLNGFYAEFVLEGEEVVAMIMHQPNGAFRAERK